MKKKENNCICSVCGKGFFRKPYFLMRGGGRFCSIPCKSIGLSKWIEKDCQLCAIRFKSKPSKEKNFCSLSCRNAFSARKRNFYGPHNPFYGKRHTIGFKKELSHLFSGRHLSPTSEFKKGANSDEKHCGWKGQEVGYSALHSWIKRKLGKPKVCEHCGKTGLLGRKIHWANKSRDYKRELTDWLRLCVPCHRAYDRV